MADRLIFQLGTNNWQRGGEFAPGSGILHESHHHAYNALPGVRCYSMYPSRRQRFVDDDVHVDPIGVVAFGSSEPMQRDTPFRIASLTKPILAAATMISMSSSLIRRGRPPAH